ncbi:hypothetical protein FGK63_01945 [Ruegeria sediminis]|uniref:XRE family transcriptional regulator n=1 Tax=Ruegeria sediminis TaxID=2583820 RepID=A0ABY2X3A3_9RHOB|nr:hypothetical protein [Ruegeria sediminis]TMV09856.1 hypothetical protein FGK63_01945 [Ruegeria sediminis]
MHKREIPYQPGAMLYEVILGCLRARGISFTDWCDGHDFNQNTVRNAMFGQSRGPRGREQLDMIIQHAGPEFVARAYADRIRRHVAEVDAAMKARGWK